MTTLRGDSTTNSLMSSVCCSTSLSELTLLGSSPAHSEPADPYQVSDLRQPLHENVSIYRGCETEDANRSMVNCVIADTGCKGHSPGLTLSQCLRTKMGSRAASRHSVSSVMLRGPYRSLQECRLPREAPAWTNTMFVGCSPIAVEMTKCRKGICTHTPCVTSCLGNFHPDAQASLIYTASRQTDHSAGEVPRHTCRMGAARLTNQDGRTGAMRTAMRNGSS